MFVEVANPYSWVEPVTHLGVPGVLMIGISMLWRSYQAERQANMEWQREAIEHQKDLEKLPEAIDRYRVETLAAIQQGFQRCSIK
jgi:hypothetical protein